MNIRSQRTVNARKAGVRIANKHAPTCTDRIMHMAERIWTQSAQQRAHTSQGHEAAIPMGEFSAPICQGRCDSARGRSLRKVHGSDRPAATDGEDYCKHGSRKLSRFVAPGPGAALGDSPCLAQRNLTPVCVPGAAPVSRCSQHGAAAPPRTMAPPVSPPRSPRY